MLQTGLQIKEGMCNRLVWDERGSDQEKWLRLYAQCFTVTLLQRIC